MKIDDATRLAEIKERVEKSSRLSKGDVTRITVGMASCGLAAGARKVLDTIKEDIQSHKIDKVVIVPTGCIGICKLEPIVEIIRPGEEKVSYVNVTEDKAKEIIKKHVLEGKPVKDYAIKDEKGILSVEKSSFFNKQLRIVLRNCGIINPEDIEEYIAVDGYKALYKVLTSMTPEEVIDIVKKSGLRGRGGGGFPTGLKWEYAKKAEGTQKYVVCNGDEGDPGAFMDRSVMEGDPHSIIEAMAIAGFSIGANYGYIYVRAEYPIAVRRLSIAIEQARRYGLLGRNIFNSGFDFDIELRLGAGAFVCGEETALLNSIMGKRGEPRPRPPFPAQKGVWDKPTLINNVETYANIPVIILKGAEWFSAIGTETSKGTKVFALGGNINNTGLIEVPMGTTLRKVIYDIGGGIPGGKEFKAAQTGGPSGGCIPKEYLDTPIEYETLIKFGSMMGSGGLIVMDEDKCMVDVAKFFLEFTVAESCGKCSPCRLGTKRMLEILNRITEGNGTEEDIKKLETLAYSIKSSALCGLGQTAPNPVLSTLRHFRSEYEAHVKAKKCPAMKCRSLFKYTILQDTCKKCGICARNCPVSAINGSPKEMFVIDLNRCTRCGTCLEQCPFNAIIKSSMGEGS